MELLFAMREREAPSSSADRSHVVAAWASGAEGRVFEAVDGLIERAILLHTFLLVLRLSSNQK